MIEVDRQQAVFLSPHGPRVGLRVVEPVHGQLPFVVDPDGWRLAARFVRVGGDVLELRAGRRQGIGEEDDVLALVAQGAKLLDERFEVRVHLVETLERDESGVNGVELQFFGQGLFADQAPIRVLLELLLNRQRGLTEQQILDAEVRRHHAEQILRSHHPVEQVGDRHPHRVRSAEVDVERIEIEHEDAVVGIPGELEPVTLGVRIAAFGERRELLMFDELDAVDRLRLAVLEQDEIVGGEPGDRLPVADRVGVEAHEVRAGSERGRPLRIRLLFLRLLCARSERHGRNQGRTCDRRDSRHRTSGGGAGVRHYTSLSSL